MAAIPEEIRLAVDLLNEEPFITAMQRAETLCRAAERALAQNTPALALYLPAMTELAAAVKAFRDVFAEAAAEPHPTTHQE